jgi:hypothetical protein
MSAIDDLKRFDSMWEHHLRWRRGEAAGQDGPGKYTEAVSYYSLPFAIDLLEIANEAITSAVDIQAATERRRLRRLVREEAERILADIPAEEAILRRDPFDFGERKGDENG